ncbi:hypothetical protein NLG97_g8535 [Lecanicillium saksenae]|uniref:Uncharacterized protein n=1 Tax=Lecanicillium saksenae TaxID=468837 RepID=A0ACC1QK12_9HYPO|nr:hypothetical protein NLG97_g8535 [Lecanicillium saksenae]
MSSMLWTLGTSFLHSGVVINGREYAYGGHNKKGVSGVFWSKPRTPPPGGSFRCELLHGFTLATEDEINATLQAASQQFLGPDHNLLKQNCNHFTAYLCKALTGDPGPTWLNRAASIGKALPCLVPRDWLEAPDAAAVDGELLDSDEEDDDEATERSTMLQKGRPNSRGTAS